MAGWSTGVICRGKEKIEMNGIKEGGANRPQQLKDKRQQGSKVILARHGRGSPEASERALLQRLLPVVREGAESLDARVAPLAIRLIVNALGEHAASV